MASCSTCVAKSLHGHDPKIKKTVAFSLPYSPSTLEFPNSINKFLSVRLCSGSGTTTLLSFKTRVSFFPALLLLNKSKDAKAELLQAIEPLDRGAHATPQDQKTIDQLTRKLEAVNPTKEPLKSDLLNGKWELIYTTSKSILQNERPKILRSRVNYQAINLDTLRAQNMETWPFFNQVTANLFPVNSIKVEVRFDYFRILGLIPVKAPERTQYGSLEITYLDEDLRVSRGDKGNLFILKMVDRSYRVPT